MGRHNEYQRKLGRKEAHHTMHHYPWSGSVNRVWLGAKETEISATLWALQLGKDFTFHSKFWNCILEDF